MGGIRFLLNGMVESLDDVDPTATLIDHLRYRQCQTGTKEGCAEGDCGACTVLVGDLDDGAIVWRAVNSCILFLPMLHGRAVMTVEGVSADGAMTPLQQCMAANGSSQCGFCTPGFVMSLHGRCIGARGHDLPVTDILAGNLCRCTGYGPILAAAKAVPSLAQDDRATIAALRAIAPSDTVTGIDGERRWFIPADADALARLLAAHPDARIVAGATDVGLWVTKGLQRIDTLIFIGGITHLQTIAEDTHGLTLGAAVRYADAHDAMARLHPDLGDLVRRIGGLQVRNAGTVGGNIANGSPIGDGPPALIALDATVTLRSVTGQRTIPLTDYFIAYGQQDRRPGEFVESIHIPRPAPTDIILMAKLSRRQDSDISALCGAIRLVMDGDRIGAARIAFGGMAATPRRAPACEAALTGQPLSIATIEAAAAALRTDYTPLTDVRGSAAYRLDSAVALLWRLWHRQAGVTVSLAALESDHG